MLERECVKDKESDIQAKHEHDAKSKTKGNNGKCIENWRYDNGSANKSSTPK